MHSTLSTCALWHHFHDKQVITLAVLFNGIIYLVYSAIFLSSVSGICHGLVSINETGVCTIKSKPNQFWNMTYISKTKNVTNTLMKLGPVLHILTHSDLYMYCEIEKQKSLHICVEEASKKLKQ